MSVVPSISPAPAAPAERRSGRRPAFLAVVALVAVAMLLTSCLSNNQAKTMSQLNGDRNRYGMPSLSPLSQSVNKAQAWADHLASIGYLAHSTLSSSYSVRWCALGENVGYGPYTPNVEQAFMGSTAHRDNILSGAWNHAGTGVARRGNTVYVVQEFIKTC